jgi:hypothetical protein
MKNILRKQIRLVYIIIFSFLFTSCFDKKLGLIIIENEKIKIEQYKVSEITTIHEFLDLTNKRWNNVERIYEGNIESIDSVYIENDTIFLTTKYDNPVIYDLAAIKFGYRIKVRKE